jgi:hypothetical protein
MAGDWSLRKPVFVSRKLDKVSHQLAWLTGLVVNQDLSSKIVEIGLDKSGVETLSWRPPQKGDFFKVGGASNCTKVRWSKSHNATSNQECPECTRL